MTLAPRRRAWSSAVRTSLSVGGRATPSAQDAARPQRIAIQFGKLCPKAWSRRTGGSVSNLPPRGRRVARIALKASVRLASAGAVPAPTRSRRNSRVRALSAWCWPSSPQPFQRLPTRLPPNFGRIVATARCAPKSAQDRSGASGSERRLGSHALVAFAEAGQARIGLAVAGLEVGLAAPAHVHL